MNYFDINPKSTALDIDYLCAWDYSRLAISTLNEII